MSKTKGLAILLGVLVLAACSGIKEPDSYTDKSGNTTLIETDREKCTRSCNESYSRCMDAQPTQDSNGIVGGRSAGVIGPTGMFGASADCRNDLKSCMDGCKGS